MRGPGEDSDYEELRPRLSVMILLKITKVDQNLLRMKHGVAIATESAPSESFSFLILRKLLFYRLMITYNYNLSIVKDQNVDRESCRISS